MNEPQTTAAAPVALPPATRRRWRLHWWQVPVGMTIFVIVCLVDALVVEPRWIRVRRVQLSASPTVRIVLIADTHYKGNPVLMQQMVHKINALDADFVCFAGDLIDSDSDLADDALAILATINKPVYGIRGNHDSWAADSAAAADRQLRRTGGRWLDRHNLIMASRRVELVVDAHRVRDQKEPLPDGCRRILLIHNPDALEHLKEQTFDLVLAGHTHGGQIRLPWLGNPVYDVGEYEYGLYQTPAGPLYVNPGIGTYMIDARFLARPEITVLEF